MSSVTAHAGMAPLTLPVHQIVDQRARLEGQRLERFRTGIWSEAVRDLARCGIALDVTRAAGEIRRSPSDFPILEGLRPRVINLILTDHLPILWDRGRAISGVATIFKGFPLCVLALAHAHGHQVPFLSVNSCLHELLHVLMLDIFEGRPEGAAGEMREFRIDAYATRLWLFGDGYKIRESAGVCIQRLQAIDRE